MNCQEFWNAMPQSVDAAELANHEHLQRCEPCAVRLRSQLALKQGLRAVAGKLRRIEAPARVEARLVAAFRAQSGIAASGSRSFRGRAPWMPVLTWAAAVAAVFALAVLLIRGRQPDLPAPAVSRGPELALNTMPAEFGNVDGASLVESGFIPLPNAAQIDPNEEVNLVRVEVPRSAMIALGYDVKPEEASDSVKADVMLGNDGLARAVRFLD